MTEGGDQKVARISGARRSPRSAAGGYETKEKAESPIEQVILAPYRTLASTIGGLRPDREAPAIAHVAFYAGLGMLVVADVVEWPVALALGVGHALVRSAAARREPALKGLGEALEET